MSSVLDEPCIDCGRQEAQPGRPFCAACEVALAELTARHRRRIAELDARRQVQLARVTELGLLDRDEYVTFTQPGTWIGPEWAGWSVENVGVPAGCESWPPPWPFWRFAPGDGSGDGGILYHVLGRRVFPPGSSAYLDAQWDPDTGRERITLAGLESVTNAREITHAQRGLKLLRKIDASAGRPPGSGQPVTVEAVCLEYRRWTEEYGKPPTQKDPHFTARFYLQPRQFQHRIAELRRTHGMTWPPRPIE